MAATSLLKSSLAFASGMVANPTCLWSSLLPSIVVLCEPLNGHYLRTGLNDGAALSISNGWAPVAT